MSFIRILFYSKLVLLAIFYNIASASQNCDIIIKNKKFIPGNLKLLSNETCEFGITSGKKHKIRICNRDKLVMEFESHDLKREKIIRPNKSAIISIGPLIKNKQYKFFEEFYGYKCIFRGT